MAGLAVTDQPESERAICHEKRVRRGGASFKSGEELLGEKEEVRGQRSAVIEKNEEVAFLGGGDALVPLWNLEPMDNMDGDVHAP
jgi:hypothetical protein